VSADDTTPSEQSELGQSLFAAERRRQNTALPNDQAERIYARVLAKAGVAATVAVGAGASTAAKSVAGSAASTASSAASALSGKVVVGLAIASYLAGAGTMALVRPSLPGANQDPTAEAGAGIPAPSAVVPSPVDSALQDPQADASTIAVPTPAPSGTATRVVSGDAALAEERALIDRARSALARGDSRASLEACDLHATKFPRGRLAEERELLAVQALVRSHDISAARTRAVRFRANYPNSMFLQAIERLLPFEK
jgi:hypothetical protein